MPVDLHAQLELPQKELQEVFKDEKLPHPEIAPAGFEIPAPPAKPWLLYAGIGLGVAGVALIAWLVLRYRKPATLAPHAPLKQALEAMEALRTRVDTLTPTEVAHDVSLIIRTYLEGRYAVPAPYRTTEEIYASQALATRAPLKERFEPVAVFYDRLEFARQPRTSKDSNALVDTALKALREEQDRMTQPLSVSAPPPAPAQSPSPSSSPSSEDLPPPSSILPAPPPIPLEKI